MYKQTDTSVCVVGVWFNIVLKNKLTKITLKCNRRQKKKTEKRKRKIQIINILCQQGVELQCSCKIKFTNIFIKKEFIRHIHKSRKHSFTSSELNLVYHPTVVLPATKRSRKFIFIYVYISYTCPMCE